MRQRQGAGSTQDRPVGSAVGKVRTSALKTAWSALFARPPVIFSQDLDNFQAERQGQLGDQRPQACIFAVFARIADQQRRFTGAYLFGPRAVIYPGQDGQVIGPPGGLTASGNSLAQFRGRWLRRWRAACSDQNPARRRRPTAR